MDIICQNCGHYQYVPPTDEERRNAIANLETLLEGFRNEPWLVTYLEYHEPEIMHRFYDGIEKLMKVKV